jgi:hypothetical protein
MSIRKNRLSRNQHGGWFICAVWPQDNYFMEDLWTLKEEFRTWVEQQEPGARFTNPSVGMIVIEVNDDTAFAFKLKYL